MPSIFIDPFTVIYRHRQIFIRTIVSEVRRKYAGSVMGTFWMVASPVILMALYSVIYLLIFRIQPTGMARIDYVLYIFSGLIPFLGFIEALNAGTTSLSLNKTVLLNTMFPSELVPVRTVLAAQASAAIGLIVLMVSALAFGRSPLQLLLVPLIWALLVLFVTGLVWVLSLASLVLRDIQQVLAFVSILLLTASPIAYTLDMAPGAMKVIVYANPLSYFVICLHEVVAYSRLPPLEIASAAIVLGVGSFGAGYWIFKKAKLALVDYA